MSLMPIRLEQVSTSVGKDDRSVVGAERDERNRAITRPDIVAW
jgi:hypothetical protein